MIPSRARLLPALAWSLVLLSAAAAGCGEGAGAGATPEPDVSAGGSDASGSGGAGGATGATDAVPAGGTSSDAGPCGGAGGHADATTPCASDEACGEASYCEAGVCLPAAAQYLPPADGVFRAGAARFDLAPAYFEPWTDKAGPACPDNRPGRYDGALTTGDAPPAPCDDTFEDLDGDGRFAAVWMAGAVGDRPATGVDEANPPGGRVLCLQHEGEVWLLVTLDAYAVGPEPLRALQRGLQLRLGIPTQRIAVHATGVHTAPDAVGMWGPSLALANGPLAELQSALADIPLLAQVPLESGLDRPWWNEVRRRITVAAQQAVATAVPATLRVGQIRLPALPPGAGAEPGGAEASPEPAADEIPPIWEADAAEVAARVAAPTPYAHDTRFPLQQDDTVRYAAFDAPDGAPLAVLTLWGAAPVARPGETRLSADVAGLVRQGLEAAFPGALGLWLTGAGSEEVMAGQGALVPETDAAGRLLDAPAAEPAAALARLLVRGAVDALAPAPAAEARLTVTSRYAWLALTSPRYDLGARLGVVPGLSDWMAGRLTTPVWSSGVATPACGALGCLRYRLDRVDLGPVTLVTTPAGLDESFVHGRPEQTLVLRDPESLNLVDLDLDAILDADDPEIALPPNGRDRTSVVRVEASLNPERFAAVEGLAGERTWLVGHTGGGLGSLRPGSDVVNVFEGQMAPLEALLAARPDLAALDLCLAGDDCDHALRLGALVPQVAAEMVDVLADLRGGHLLSLGADAGPTSVDAGWYRIEGPEGVVRTEGPGLTVGPGPWAFALAADFGAAGVRPGDFAVLADGRRLPIAAVTPLVLASHPSAGDQWQGLHARGGDAVYNTACELLGDGVCPHPRPVPADADPNATLPRQPDEVPPPAPEADRAYGHAQPM